VNCMRGFLFLVLSAVFCCQALARLGETEKECEARYGDPIHYVSPYPESIVPDAQERWFKKSKLNVRVLFQQDKAVYIYFQGERGPITRDVEKALLDANGNGEWKDQDIESDYWSREFGVELGTGPRTWHSASGDRIAYRVYDSGAGGLMIADMRFYESAKSRLEHFNKKVIDRFKEWQAGQLKKRMEGF